MLEYKKASREMRWGGRVEKFSHGEKAKTVSRSIIPLRVVYALKTCAQHTPYLLTASF
jgi:hypothetical protein